ncbi:hypothetical protein P154DRAFT_78937 [Amniculicola lignicola CBS 123094]|uniref:Zn(2)-C6 fungal-type domain-containing protein n=1 Tax=Amniculicola lignicola CBS 123094 TaxID=1392246 RepID=A0A6A5WNZ7_9PLEO|nr:hypothetical protein P154DRAFT_78937 [Amniculicola lignicola CBS 123094]
MVNTGRSKGCSACRRRKIKCDENQPICKRCQKSGLECDGPKELLFVEGKIIKPRGTPSEPRESTSPPRPQGTEVDYSRRLLSIFAPLQGNKYETYLIYLRQHIMKGAPIDSALQESQLSDIVTARTSTSNGQVFNQAVLSFATIVFGTWHKQTAIVNEGFTMHGKALQQLNQALSDSQRFGGYEVLLAVCTFGMLEFLIPTGPQNYMKHMLGLEKLFELRGTTSFVSPKELHFLACCRYMNVFASLSLGRPSIFARPEWKEVVTRASAHEAALDRELWDILANCTIPITRGDDLVKRWDNTAEMGVQRDILRRRGLASVNALNDWRTRWMSDERTLISEIPSDSLELQYMRGAHGDITPIPFLKVLKFTNDWTAMLLMACDTTLIRVLQMLSCLPLAMPSDQTGLISLHGESSSMVQSGYFRERSNDEFRTAARVAALEICRCLPSRLSQVVTTSSSEPSPIIDWAVTSAWEALGGNGSIEGRWLGGYMKRKLGDEGAVCLLAT